MPIPALLSAAAIRYRLRWGRQLGIVVGAMLVPMFPFGTVVGLVVMWVLSHPVSNIAFHRGVA